MEIIGSGFIARHLRPLHGAHPDTVVLAAGVPRQKLPDSEHRREAALVTETIQRCLRERRVLVFFSTASMYGGPGCQGREDDPVVPSTRYGQHKYDLETVIRESGVDHLILRLSYVLGPGGPEFRLIPALVRQIVSGRVRVQPGSRRDMLYVSDFVTIMDRLLDAKVRNQIVNVASGDCVDIVQIIKYIEYRLGVTAERQTVADDSVSHCPSVAKLRELIPEVTEMGFGPGYHRHAIERYLNETGPVKETHP
ncbi:NAD(P)-dependent oxidoreductase [Actinomadura craniellae]|uniref:NAD(P)-dependent oxidoreductase n=1 Tax=Actinomadura craniellae TaxID=2231787 RepID=A0A365H0Y3_9ACTN|nr:NAD-dependent epimerase/dehydratase family protein [Actinomadura craniellae]RAY12709.1 NAD(P)-dependent oxidoreductase [Actinomadura craniellae]